MTDDVEFCSLLASTLDGLGRPGMAEELVLQKPPPFFAAEFDILSWYSIILWKLSQTCHFYLERQKQVQHSPTVCFNAFFIGPAVVKLQFFLPVIHDWLQTTTSTIQHLFTFFFCWILTVMVWRTKFSLQFTSSWQTYAQISITSSKIVFLWVFSPFDVLSSAGSVVLGKGQRCQIRVSRQSPKNLRKSPNWHV